MTGSGGVGNRAPSLGGVPVGAYLTRLEEMLVQDSDTYTNLRIELSETYYADGRHFCESRLTAAAQGGLADVTVEGDLLMGVEPVDNLTVRVAKILTAAFDQMKNEFYTEAADAR